MKDGDSIDTYIARLSRVEQLLVGTEDQLTDRDKRYQLLKRLLPRQQVKVSCGKLSTYNECVDELRQHEHLINDFTTFTSGNSFAAKPLGDNVGSAEIKGNTRVAMCQSLDLLQE